MTTEFPRETQAELHVEVEGEHMLTTKISNVYLNIK